MKKFKFCSKPCAWLTVLVVFVFGGIGIYDWADSNGYFSLSLLTRRIIAISLAILVVHVGLSCLDRNKNQRKKK